MSVRQSFPSGFPEGMIASAFGIATEAPSGEAGPMKKTLPVDMLLIGMKVVGLDKSWIETSFLSHTFTIRSEKDIEKLQRNGVRTVTVEIEDPPAAVPKKPMTRLWIRPPGAVLSSWRNCRRQLRGKSVTFSPCGKRRSVFSQGRSNRRGFKVSFLPRKYGPMSAKP